MLDDEMSAAWREAGIRLSIQVLAPYSLVLLDGTTVPVEAFVPDFGGPYGVVAVALADEPRCRLAATGNVFVAQMAASYRVFEDALFRATLDDWGWHGPADRRPAWYSGKPWS